MWCIADLRSNVDTQAHGRGCGPHGNAWRCHHAACMQTGHGAAGMAQDDLASGCTPKIVLLQHTSA